MRVSIFVLAGLNITVAVFVLNFAVALITPGTLFNALRIVIGQNLQVMPGTSSTTVLVSAAATFCDKLAKLSMRVINIVRKTDDILILLKYIINIGYLNFFMQKLLIQKTLSRNKEKSVEPPVKRLRSKK